MKKNDKVIDLRHTNQSIRSAVNAFKAETPNVLKAAAALKGKHVAVTSEEEADLAKTDLAGLNKLVKEYQKLRLEATRALDGLKKQIIEYERSNTAPAMEVLSTGKEAIAEFQRKVEAERQAEIARLEAERQAEGEEGEEGSAEPIQTTGAPEKVAMINELKKQQTQKKVGEITILDISKVPAHLYEVTFKKKEVMAYLNANGEVPGLKVQTEEVVVLR